MGSTSIAGQVHCRPHYPYCATTRAVPTKATLVWGPIPLNTATGTPSTATSLKAH